MTNPRLSPLAELAAADSRELTPQAEHHFTTMKQVDALVAGRGDVERGFVMRLLLLCSLPRTNPGKRTRYIRKNGPYTLVMSAAGEDGLPYGNIPRLLLAWMCTEAVRTQSRTLTLGRSMYEFIAKLGIAGGDSGGRGGVRTRLKNQMRRLFGASVSLTVHEEGRERFVRGNVVSAGDLWWNPADPEAPALFESQIKLGEEFFNEVIRRPVPLDMKTLRELARSSLGLDLYMWLVYRTFTLTGAQFLTWRQLYVQFGADPSKAGDNRAVQNLRMDLLRELKKIRIRWPELNVEVVPGGLVIRPSKPLIAPKGAAGESGAVSTNPL